MPQELEADVEGWCVDYANDLGWMNIKLDKISRAWPDQLFFGPGGRKLLVEFKRPGEDARPQQAKRHRELGALGHQVEVVKTRNHFCELVSQALVQEQG